MSLYASCVLMLGVGVVRMEAKNTYFIGNSVTDSVSYPQYQALVQSRGDPVSWARHIILGAPLELIWNSPENGFLEQPYGGYANALPNYDWDAVSLQTYDRGFASDRASIGQFIELARQRPYNAQNTVFYIMGRWPRQDKGDYQAYWQLENDGTTARSETADYFSDLVEAARADEPGAEIRMVPVGHIFFDLDQRMEAGLVPGFTDITQFYSDGVHMNAYGRYTTAVAYYTTLYGKDPRGMGVGEFDVDPAVAEIIQEAAWVQVNSLSHLTGVDAGGALEITTDFLPLASSGRGYSFALRAVFGESPYSWTLASGSLPTGITLNPSGLVSGQTNAVGSYPVTIRLTDAAGTILDWTTSFEVVENTAPEVVTTTIAPLHLGTPASISLERSGGEPPFTWSVVGGSLPPGLQLSAAGAITGTPWKTGNYAFTVQIADGDDPAETDTAALEISVGAALNETILVHRTFVPMELDGVFSEPQWSTATPVAQIAAGVPGASGSFRVLWDFSALYVAIEVVDNSPSAGDGDFDTGDAVEILIDGLHDREFVFNADDRQIMIPRSGDGAEFFGRDEAIRFARTTSATGYRIEAVIPWQNLAQPPIEGKGIGIDVLIHDADGAGNRFGTLAWRDTDPAELSPARFGNLLLSDTPVGPKGTDSLMAYEPFAPGVGLLNGHERAAGFAPWSVQNAPAASSYQKIDNLPLTYGSHRGSGELRTSGGRASGGDGYLSSGVLLDVAASFAELASGGAISKDGSLWVSWLARAEVGSAPARFQLSKGTLAWVESDAQVRVQRDGGKWMLSVGGAPAVDTGVTADTSTTYLMVLHLELGPVTDRVHLYINPGELGGTAPVAPTLSVDSPAQLAIQRIHWYPGSSSANASLDEIRLGSSFAAVTPVLARKPEIDAQPQGGLFRAGENVSLSVEAFSRSDLTFQWYLDGTLIPDANVATLNLGPLDAGDFGSYTVAVSNDAGTTVSSVAELVEKPAQWTASYDAWLSGKSWAVDSDRWPEANPDGDRFTNLEEYVFGLNPLQGESVHPEVVQIESAAGQATVRFGPLRVDAELSYSILGSSNLEAWSAVDSADYQTQTVNGQATLILDFNPASQSDRFFRLEIR